MLSFALLLSGAALVAGVALPVTQDQSPTTAEHPVSNFLSEEEQQLRHKRQVFGSYAVAHAAPIVAAPVVYHASILPTAVSHSERVDIHKSGAIIQPALLYRKKRGVSVTYPVASSHHAQTQIHNSALLHHYPLIAPAAYHAPVVQGASIVAPGGYLLPAATSSSSRFQIHNNARIIHEYHEPLYALAPAFAPVHATVEEHHYVAQPAAVAPLAEAVVPAFAGLPVQVPAQIAQAGQQQSEGQQQETPGAASAAPSGEGDSVTVDAARKAH